MKDISLLVWLTQLGISVAVPPVVLILLGVWLRDRFSLGNWVVIVAIITGVILAVDGLRASLKVMNRLSNNKKQESPPVSFNEHL